MINSCFILEFSSLYYAPFYTSLAKIRLKINHLQHTLIAENFGLSAVIFSLNISWLSSYLLYLSLLLSSVIWLKTLSMIGPRRKCFHWALNRFVPILL